MISRVDLKFVEGCLLIIKLEIAESVFMRSLRCASLARLREYSVLYPACGYLWCWQTKPSTSIGSRVSEQHCVVCSLPAVARSRPSRFYSLYDTYYALRSSRKGSPRPHASFRCKHFPLLTEPPIIIREQSMPAS